MAAAKWTAADIPDQTGRTVVITGANSGLGRASASMLAGAGAHVILACRNAQKATKAADDLRSTHPSTRIDVRELDLASLASVRRFADDLVASGQRIDLLMNNAGIMAVDRGTTEDGFELQFGVNHLGHFALTGLLLPVLLANPDGARIVNVSSMGHRAGRMDLDDPNAEHRQYRRWPAYFQSKLANLLFTAELHQRLSRSNSRVLAIAAHPGTATTELGKVGSSASNWVIRRAFFAMVRGPEPGALSQVRAATDPTVRGGDYFGPRWMMAGRPQLETPSKRARSTTDAARLWELSERLTGVTYGL